MERPSRFLLLCLAEREATCMAALAGLGHRFDTEVRPREAIRRCIEGEVAATLVDTVSSVRIGIHEMAPLYDMGIDLPVLRVSGWDATPTAMCSAPFRKGPLAECLDEIASGNPAWHHPLYARRNLRVPLPTRIEIKTPEGTIRSYGLNASVAGIFAIAWEPPPADLEVELNFLDLPFPFRTKTRTRRSIPWGTPSRVPGCGLAFLEPPPREFRHLIADIHFRRLSGVPSPEPGLDLPEPSSFPE